MTMIRCWTTRTKFPPKLAPLLVTAAIVATTLLLSACASAQPPTALQLVPTIVPSPTPGGRGSGGTLRLMFWQAPTELNPHLTTSAKDWSASRIVYEPLASYDKGGNLVPFLAAEIPSLENGDVAPDGKSVTWKLKRGVKWSDGAPFTAADVRFTFDYVTNPKVNASTAATYSAVASVDVIDDYTVKVNFKDVNPAWSLPFVGIPGMIIPQHIFQAYNGANAGSAPANLAPVGTGPYRFVSLKPQGVLFLGDSLVETNQIVFEANPLFREPDKPFFGRVELDGGGTVNEAARSVLQFGDEDYANNLQIDAALQKQLEAYGKGKVVAPFGAFVERILLNFTDPNKAAPDGERSSTQFPNPFFSDPKVRQAFALAIDRNAIAKLYGPTGETTANLLVSPEAYQSTDTSWEFNLDKASKLLDEAGWVRGPDGIRVKNGERLSVSYQTSTNSVRQQTQQIVKKDLNSIGVDVQLNFYDSSVFFSDGPADTRNRRHFYADMEEFSTANRSPYPGPYMDSWVCNQAAQKANNWNGLNIERYCNPAYDALYQQSLTELNPIKSQQLFKQMNDLLVKDVVEIPLVRQADISGVSNTLTGVNLTPWDADTWDIKDWSRATP
jgi:peptide/nickel transport system substrate-binding protein